MTQDISKIMSQAADAFLTFEKTSPADRANFLDTIATEIEAIGDELIQTASAETNLPNGRFIGERARTCGQLRLFADLLREGSWVNAVIETAIHDRTPLPKPDMRKMDIAIGPIVVFGASNFPLAYATAGGDTASALAAGCSVVVRGHQAHPKTSVLVARAIKKAIEICQMHSDTFQLVEGEGFDVGKALVIDNHTAAVGFTGSLAGGRAIFDYGQQRKNPIPVFAEMGSTNPVILLPQKLNQDRAEMAKLFASSVTMGVGQFCTNPSIILGIKGEDLDLFETSLANEMASIPAFKMLHQGIHQNYLSRLQSITSTEGVKLVYRHIDDTEMKAPPVVASVLSSVFHSHPTLHEEVFGPSTIIVHCENKADLIRIWRLLYGQLTTTIMGTQKDLLDHQDLTDIARQIAGRIVYNAAPTGVDVNAATVHGGPYPSTTDSRFTSVGMDSIKRWVRPICYQDCPDELLPRPLQNANPDAILRKVNGIFHRDPIS